MDTPQLRPIRPITKTDFYTLQNRLETLWASKKHLIIAIEGKTGSGKTALAEYLSSYYKTSIIQMDDFFLPPLLRTNQRMSEPGGNVHYERFLVEVHAPLLRFKRPLSTRDWQELKRSIQSSNSPNLDPILAKYNVFSCKNDSFEFTRPIYMRPLIIIEGTYCMRPEFRDLYNLSVFLDISPSLQIERLRNRVGAEDLINYENQWIPLENLYFETGIADECNYHFEADHNKTASDS